MCDDVRSVTQAKNWCVKAYYNALLEAGGDEQLAKDNTNNWAAVSNDGMNGKPLYCFSFLLF